MDLSINCPRIVRSGKEVRSLTVFDASVSLNITPLSTATFTLAEGEQVNTREFFRVYTAMGSAGIFRARSPQIGVGGQKTTVELDHAIVEVGDYLLKGEIEEETTLSKAMTKIFSFYKGGKWKLGTVAKGSTKVVLKSDYDNCLDAILDVLSQVPAVYLTFSFTAFPWTVNVAAKPTTVTAEGRISRNIKSATISQDDSELCTRVFLEGLPGTSGSTYGHIDSDTLKKYGTVEREIDGPHETEAQAKRTAELYLEKHKRPAYSISIDAIDLSAITGETLDKFTLGKKMRLALPDYGITVEETITQISWNNVYTNPRSMTITLSDEKESVLKTIKDNAKKARSAGGGGRKNKKKIEETLAAVEVNKKDIAIWAKETDENGSILKKAGLSIDKNGVLQYATDIKNGIYATIKTAADGVYTHVANVKQGLDTKIETTASGIRSTVNNVKNNLSSRIDQEAGRISAVVDGDGGVKASVIVDAINGSSVTISAERIQLDGKTTADILEGQDITCSILDATSAVQAPYATINDMDVDSISVSGSDMLVCDASVSGNVLTIHKVDGNDVTFSKATTLSGEWSGNVAAGKSYKVEAKQNGTVVNTHYSPALDDMYPSGTKTWAQDKKSFTQKIRVQDANGVDLFEEELPFTTSDSYYAGSASVGIGSIGTSGGSSSNSSRTLKCSTTGRTNTSGTSDNSSTTYEIALSKSGNYVYCKHGGTTLCRIAVGVTPEL